MHDEWIKRESLKSETRNEICHKWIIQLLFPLWRKLCSHLMQMIRQITLLFKNSKQFLNNKKKKKDLLFFPSYRLASIRLKGSAPNDWDTANDCPFPSKTILALYRFVDASWNLLMCWFRPVYCCGWESAGFVTFMAEIKHRAEKDIWKIDDTRGGPPEMATISHTAPSIGSFT